MLSFSNLRLMCAYGGRGLRDVSDFAAHGLGASARSPRLRRTDAVSLALRALSDVFCDLHGTEGWPAHRAEMGLARDVGRQRFVMIASRGRRVEGEVELIFTTKREARPRHGIVPLPRTTRTLGYVGGVSAGLVHDDAGLDILAVGQPEVLLGGDVTKHGGSIPANQRRADGRGDVVVAGRDVGDQIGRASCRERV